MEALAFAGAGALIAFAGFAVGAAVGRRRAYRSYLVSIYAGASTLILALNNIEKGDGETGKRLLRSQIDASLATWDAKDRSATSRVPADMDLSAVDTVVDRYRKGDLAGKGGA
ncbi:MAG: hypothetical protein JW909_03530 [Planctomycetes bacterium]|nr:hypothetical protein [Planctomycetota bacterium]